VAEGEEPEVCAGVRQIGSHSLGAFPHAVDGIDRERCGRAGSYRRDGLVARFGADISTWPRAIGVGISLDHAGALFTDVAWRP